MIVELVLVPGTGVIGDENGVDQETEGVEVLETAAETVIETAEEGMIRVAVLAATECIQDEVSFVLSLVDYILEV